MLLLQLDVLTAKPLWGLQVLQHIGVRPVQRVHGVCVGAATMCIASSILPVLLLQQRRQILVPRVPVLLLLPLPLLLPLQLMLPQLLLLLILAFLQRLVPVVLMDANTMCLMMAKVVKVVGLALVEMLMLLLGMKVMLTVTSHYCIVVSVAHWVLDPLLVNKPSTRIHLLRTDLLMRLPSQLLAPLTASANGSRTPGSVARHLYL